MARKNVKRYVLRYGVLAGIPSGVAILALAVLASIPLPLVALVLTFVALTFAALLVGVSEAGIETASTGAEAGFMSGSDAMQYQPAEIPIPDRLAIVCWLLGVGVVGIAALATYT